MPSLDPSRETTAEEGGGSVSVSNVLWGSGTCGVTLWVGYLSFSVGNVQEVGGGVHGVSQTDYGKYGQAAVVWDLYKRGSRECTQRSGNTYTGDVH